MRRIRYTSNDESSDPAPANIPPHICFKLNPENLLIIFIIKITLIVTFQNIKAYCFMFWSWLISEWNLVFRINRWPDSRNMQKKTDSKKP